MNWEYFILFAIAALVCWALGAFVAWKGTKPGWAYGFTFLGLAIFFQLHYRNVDFIGTPSDANHGGDPAVVFFLPSVGGIDNIHTLEVQMDS